MENIKDLPVDVQKHLEGFVESAKKAWGNDLSAAILYGSAAEGQLRPTSDVNLLLILRRFDQSQVNEIRDAFRLARVAIRLGVMFLLETEIAEAMTAFAVKFDDMIGRHRLLYGKDPFVGLEIPRKAALARLQQALLNVRLRLRERYALVSLREEQLVTVAADLAGPLRSCAATLLKLEGQKIESPKTALLKVVEDLGPPRFTEAVKSISEAREARQFAPGVAESLIFALMELVMLLQSRAERLE